MRQYSQVLGIRMWLSLWELLFKPTTSTTLLVFLHCARYIKVKKQKKKSDGAQCLVICSLDYKSYFQFFCKLFQGWCQILSGLEVRCLEQGSIYHHKRNTDFQDYILVLRFLREFIQQIFIKYPPCDKHILGPDTLVKLPLWTL